MSDGEDPDKIPIWLMRVGSGLFAFGLPVLFFAAQYMAFDRGPLAYGIGIIFVGACLVRLAYFIAERSGNRHGRDEKDALATKFGKATRQGALFGCAFFVAACVLMFLGCMHGMRNWPS